MSECYENSMLVLAQMGVDTWNRWAVTVLREKIDRAPQIYNAIEFVLKDIAPLNESEYADLMLKLGLASRDTLPNQFEIDSHTVNIDFSNYIFPIPVFFKGVTFHHSNFIRSCFIENASFDGSIFANEVSFKESLFCGSAFFNRVTFNGVSRFEGITSRDGFYCENSQFYSAAYFKESKKQIKTPID